MKKIKASLREINPEAADMWAYDLNGDLTPDNVGGHSDTEAHFRCLNNPKHVFKKPISKMTSFRDGHNVGCIYCSPNAKIAFPGETDLLTVCPEASEMWDYELNKDLNPIEILPKSSKRAYFKCENGHSTHRTINDFCRSPYCPECEKQKTKLVYQFPNTRLFWNDKKNVDANLDDIIQSSRYNATFSCPNCKYEWVAQVSLWNKRRYCPCCGFDGTEGSIERNRELIAMNPITTFRMDNPIAADMWDYSANGDKTPDNVSKGSNYKAHFICEKGHKFQRVVYDMKTGCPHCSSTHKAAYRGETDFFTVCPVGKEMWDYELNKDIVPEKLTANSGVFANFICSRGHRFKKRIQAFTKYPICKECNLIDKRSIPNARPEMLEYWDYDRNVLSPYEVSPYSKEDAFWKCKRCGYEWTQKIASRSSASKGKCPSCDMSRVVNPGQVMNGNFREANPEAAKLWIDEMNEGMTPDNMPSKSAKKVYMRCMNNPQHIYQRKIYEISSMPPYSCPECLGMRYKAIPDVSDLFTVCEPAKRMWDYDKNKGYDLTCIYPKSTNKVWWKCEKGHNFERAISGFVDSQNCPECKALDVAIANFPHLVKQWDFKKNRGIDINLTSACSKKEVWWKCKKCNYEWQAQIASRKSSKGLCPCCENRTVVAEGITDLFSMVPDLMKSYDFTKNVEIDAKTLSVASLESVWWKCSECSYEWTASPTGRIRYENGKYIARSCPACIGQVRTITYAEEYPDLAERFMYELNGCTLADVFPKDWGTNFWWHCDICGENFECSLGSMVRGRRSSSKGCSYCAGKKVTREKSFATLHPEVMAEYDPCNAIDPYAVTENSSLKAKWICKYNPNHRWIASFYLRAHGQGGCNICRNYQYEKMFYEEHADFEVFYDTNKNERPFKSYSNASNEKVWWRCEKGHLFEYAISNFCNSEKFRCPYCEQRWLKVGINSLADTHSDLIAEWSDSNDTVPTDFVKKSTYKALWICPTCSGEYTACIRDREVGDDSCPYCTGRRKLAGFNTLDVTKKELISEWSYNNERPMDDFFDTSAYMALWICPTCNGEYSARIRDREHGDDSCPYCMNKRKLAGYNTLEVTKSELIPEWSSNNEQRMDEFFDTSSYLALWICSTCNGEYRARIRDRELGDDSCPYCTNKRKLAGFNTLEVTKPELVPEWSNNNERGMDEFFDTSCYMALWICSICNGEYQARIKTREVGDDSCPYCRGIRVLSGYNSFKIKHPDLMEEWDYINNYVLCDADKILENYSVNVWWICRDCGKRYYTSPNRKVYFQKRHMTACTYCKGLRRKKKYFF